MGEQGQVLKHVADRAARYIHVDVRRGVEQDAAADAEAAVVGREEAAELARRLEEAGLPASWRVRRGRGVVTWKSAATVGTLRAASRDGSMRATVMPAASVNTLIMASVSTAASRVRRAMILPPPRASTDRS